MRLEQNHDFTHQLITQAWGNSWGIFAITPPSTTLIALRRNLRKLAYVTDANNRKLLFRYYDPRVLRRFLSTDMQSDQLADLFGPASHYITENETACGLQHFSLTQNNGLFALNQSYTPLFNDQ